MWIGRGASLREEASRLYLWDRLESRLRLSRGDATKAVLEKLLLLHRRWLPHGLPRGLVHLVSGLPKRLRTLLVLLLLQLLLLLLHEMRCCPLPHAAYRKLRGLHAAILRPIALLTLLQQYSFT